ncbi:MAG: PatB family C-S lyase [Desulfobacteraceae bacterium]|nr:PatB family C-S lyase [Desulfobacteraceae bacterium]
MKYDFDQIVDRNNTYSLKWEKYKSTDILPMWVADMDFKCPPAIIEELHKQVDHSIFGYSVVPDKLYEVTIKNLKKLYDWDVKKEWIMWFPGIVSGINVCCKAFSLSDGLPSKIATTTPVYPPFLSAPDNAGNNLVTIPLIEKNQRMTFDFPNLEKVFSENNISLFILCSPYNPCGTVFTEEELTTLAELCSKYKVIICSDEIHSDFVLDIDKKHIPTPCISELAAQNTLTFMAPSKTFNIPGLGCSFAVVKNAKLMKKLKTASRDIVPDVNTLGLIAAAAAYEKCDEWLSELILYLRSNRDYLEKEIDQLPDLKLNHIEATYLAWIDVRNANIKNPAQFFENAGVGLSCGSFFGQEGFVRLNFGCPKSRLEQAVERIKTALNNVKH